MCRVKTSSPNSRWHNQHSSIYFSMETANFALQHAKFQNRPGWLHICIREAECLWLWLDANNKSPCATQNLGIGEVDGSPPSIQERGSCPYGTVSTSFHGEEGAPEFQTLALDYNEDSTGQMLRWTDVLAMPLSGTVQSKDCCLKGWYHLFCSDPSGQQPGESLVMRIREVILLECWWRTTAELGFPCP